MPKHEHTKKLFTITVILLGIGMLIMSLMSIFYLKEFNELSFSPLSIGAIFTVFGILSGIITTANVFRDMSNIQICDVTHSLPFSSRERFLSKILTLSYIHIIPTVVSTAIASIVANIACIKYGASPALTISLFLMFTAAVLFTDAIAVLCCCCCGAFAESIYFTAIVLGGLSIAPAAFFNIVCCEFAGLESVMGFVRTILSCWTYFFITLDTDTLLTSGFWIECIISCVISVVVMFNGYRFYKKRDAKTVGTPIANKPFFEFVMILGLFSVYGLSFMNENAFIAIFALAAVYVVINIVVTRAKLTLKSFMVWLLKFTASTAAYILILGIAYFTNGFGLIHYTPASDLTGTEVTIGVYVEKNSTDSSLYDEIYYFTNKSGNLTDKQVHELTKILQKYMAKREKSLSDFTQIVFDGNNINSATSSASIDISKYVTEDELNKNTAKYGYYTYYNSEKGLYGLTAFNQGLNISNDDAEQLINELKDSDLITNYSHHTLGSDLLYQ